MEPQGLLPCLQDPTKGKELRDKMKFFRRQNAWLSHNSGNLFQSRIHNLWPSCAQEKNEYIFLQNYVHLLLPEYWPSAAYFWPVTTSYSYY